MTYLVGNLQKGTLTTVIPADPGEPATPGSPAVPARCWADKVNVCEWYTAAEITSVQVCHPDFYFPDGRKIPAHCVQQPRINGSSLSDLTLAGVNTKFQLCHTVDRIVCDGGSPAQPGTPGRAPTTAQKDTSLNSGWNSHSRSIAQIQNDYYFRATVDPSNSAAFFGVDSYGKDTQPLTAYHHGLMLDRSGVWVFERGAQVTQLLSGFHGETAIRIERRSDGTIRYVAAGASHTSAVRVDAGETLYIYGRLYTGHDRVLSASFAPLTVAEGYQESLTLFGESELRVGAPVVNGVFLARLELVGAGLLSSDSTLHDTDGTLIGTGISGWIGSGAGELRITPIYANALGYLPALAALASEVEYSFGLSELPPVEFTGTMYADYVPPRGTEGYGTLPYMASVGIVVNVDFCQGSGTLPELLAIGGDYAYGVASSYLPPLFSYGAEGRIGEMVMLSYAFATDLDGKATDLVMFVMSSGTLQSVYTGTLMQVMELISALSAESISTVVGLYGLDLDSNMVVRSISVQSIDGKAALDNSGRVWVVNVDSGASVQYENYGFNSFFVRDGLSYGVADDGIYRLSGYKDLDSNIESFVQMQTTRMGSMYDKTLPAVYINAASTGKLILKVVADGNPPYYYEARSSSEHLDNHRVDVGRGLKGNNWTFTLMNQAGDDFDIAHMEFVPVQGTRRI